MSDCWRCIHIRPQFNGGPVRRPDYRCVKQSGYFGTPGALEICEFAETEAGSDYDEIAG